MKDFKRGGYSRDGGAGAPRREGGFGGGERKSFGDKPSFGGKPAYGSKPAFGGARSFSGKPAFSKPWENRGGKPSFSDKPMYDAVCSNCGKPCQVPFKPNGMKPVLCNDCFSKQNGEETFVRNDRSDRNDAPRSFDRGSDRAPAAKPANDYRIDNLAKQMENIAGKLDTLIGLMSKKEEAAPKKAIAKKEAPAKKTIAKAPAKKAAKKK